jgi:hypothetical protein
MGNARGIYRKKGMMEELLVDSPPFGDFHQYEDHESDDDKCNQSH